MGLSTGGGANTPNLEDLLRLGINAAKNGNRENARVIFQQVLDQDKRNERAWLWLASVTDDTIERRRLLKTVLDINPSNANAKKLLHAMDQAVTESERRSLRLGVWILVIAVAIIVVALLVAMIIAR
ncbi:MAG: hypothetical protein IT323_11185 [Anaerolineae bacterium]|nr:hypothetical protein [Anaerolineae bacterium]